MVPVPGQTLRNTTCQDDERKAWWKSRSCWLTCSSNKASWGRITSLITSLRTEGWSFWNVWYMSTSPKTIEINGAKCQSYCKIHSFLVGKGETTTLRITGIRMSIRSRSRGLETVRIMRIRSESDGSLPRHVQMKVILISKLDSLLKCSVQNWGSYEYKAFSRSGSKLWKVFFISFWRWILELC